MTVVLRCALLCAGCKIGPLILLQQHVERTLAKIVNISSKIRSKHEQIEKVLYPHVCRPCWEGPSQSYSIHPHNCKRWLLSAWRHCAVDIYCRPKTLAASGKTPLCRLKDEEGRGQMPWGVRGWIQKGWDDKSRQTNRKGKGVMGREVKKKRSGGEKKQDSMVSFFRKKKEKGGQHQNRKISLGGCDGFEVPHQR